MTVSKLTKAVTPTQRADELRELIREANGVRNDLEKMLRESQAALDKRVEDHVKRIEEQIADRINEFINAAGPALNSKVADADLKVRKYFHDLVADLLTDLTKQCAGARQNLIDKLTAAHVPEKTTSLAVSLYSPVEGHTILGIMEEWLEDAVKKTPAPRKNRSARRGA